MQFLLKITKSNLGLSYVMFQHKQWFCQDKLFIGLSEISCISAGVLKNLLESQSH